MEKPTSPIESSINHSENLNLTNTIQHSPKHWEPPNPSITTHYSCEDTLLFNGKLPPQYPTNNSTTTESTQNQSFIHTIYNLCRSNSKLKETTNNNKILFISETSMNAAVHNANVLESYNFNLDSALQAQKNTILYYGSEFKNTSELEPILSEHPLWKYTKDTLENGAKFPLIQSMMSPGNQTTTSTYQEETISQPWTTKASYLNYLMKMSQEHSP